MKNSAIIILSYLVTISSCFAFQKDDNKKQNDWVKEGLHGKAKSMKVTSFKAVKEIDKISKGETFYADYSLFSQEGNLLEEIHYNAEGSIERSSGYLYDDSGNKI